MLRHQAEMNPGDPEQYAKENPGVVVRDLDRLWGRRPGLLAHAICHAAEHADLDTLGDLRQAIDTKYLGYRYAIVVEAAFRAAHTLACRCPDKYLDWARSVLEKPLSHPHHPGVLEVVNEILEDLDENPPRI